MRFEGDFDHLWRIGHRPPIRRLTWDWWWWLIMLDGGSGPDAQVMALWSTKDTPSIDVNGRPWSNQGRPRSTATRQVLSGQVCAWYFDGEQMHEPLIQTPCRMAALTDQDPSWGSSGIGSGGGAVVPLVDQDLSMGLASDRSSFWLNLQPPFDDGFVGGPRSMRFRIEPWTDVLSTLRPASADYALGMGYDILRMHGAKVSGTIDGCATQGTAYFQKVCVQAPAVPWYWGLLHLSDGTYLDWFLPHVSMTMTSLDDRPWRRRDVGHLPLSQGGLLHDASAGRTERFARVEVRKERGPDDLPIFNVRMWNGRTEVVVEAAASSRAHWSFDQSTWGGLRSHLTYNEYPLEVRHLRITSPEGVRTERDVAWIRGNAEHAWGLLH